MSFGPSFLCFHLVTSHKWYQRNLYEYFLVCVSWQVSRWCGDLKYPSHYKPQRNNPWFTVFFDTEFVTGTLGWRDSNRLQQAVLRRREPPCNSEYLLFLKPHHSQLKWAPPPLSGEGFLRWSSHFISNQFQICCFFFCKNFRIGICCL